MGERGNHLCLAQKHTRNTSCIHSTAFARPSYTLRHSRLTEEEYAEFSERVTLCKISQAEFIRQALIKSSIRPVITVSPVNDELLSAVGKLTAEYGKIGGNLNQIARCLNEYGAPYNALSKEVRAATAEHPARYSSLILIGKLWTYLADLNEQTEEPLDLIIEQMKAAEGVTEELKAQNQLEWVGRTNNIRNRAEEIVKSEMIYL